MIQRVQSIYIILSIIVVFVATLFPFGSYEIGDQIVSFGAFGWKSENNLLISSQPEVFLNYPYFIGYLLTISLSIFTLLKYKNRNSQLSLGKANYFVLLITIIYMFLSVTISEEIVSEDPTYGVGLYLLVSAIPFIFLANRGVKNDEKLIKSLDRLR
jgi:hypothetical protein